ncbi:MAG: DMT family transporter [Clostridia bacterium]|nr:DMT family transporter [Clostridia bacterium]
MGTRAGKFNPETFFSKNWVICIGSLFCCVLWGTTAPLIKTCYSLFGLDTENVGSLILFAGLRFLLAGILVIAVTSAIRRKFVYPKAKNWWRVGLLSVFETIAHYIFYYIGLAYVSGVKSSIMGGTAVFFTILAACFLFRTEKFTWIKLLGCILGFGGVILINIGGEFTFTFTLKGEGFLLFSAIFSALAAAVTRVFAKHEDPAVLYGYQFLLGGVVLVAAGLIAGGEIPVADIGAIFILIFLALISASTFTLQGYLLKYCTVSKVAIYKSLDPVFSALFSALILTEWNILFSPFNIAALIIVCVGIYIVNRFGDWHKKPRLLQPPGPSSGAPPGGPGEEPAVQNAPQETETSTEIKQQL